MNRDWLQAISRYLELSSLHLNQIPAVSTVNSSVVTEHLKVLRDRWTLLCDRSQKGQIRNLACLVGIPVKRCSPQLDMIDVFIHY